MITKALKTICIAVLLAGFAVLSAEAATTYTAPSSITAIANTDGSISVTWTASTSSDTTDILTYDVYRDTTRFVDNGSLAIAASISRTAVKDYNTLNNITYYYIVYLVINGVESGITSDIISTTAYWPQQVSLTTNTNLISYESNAAGGGFTSANLTFNITNNPPAGPAKKVDIIFTDVWNGTVVLTDTYYGTSTFIDTWDGYVKDSGRWVKHCGEYKIKAVATNYNGTQVESGEVSVWVDVVNINREILAYVREVPDETSYHQKFGVTYYLTKDAWVTIKITQKSAAGSTVRTLLDETPRPGESLSRDRYNTDVWDGRDDTGKLVPNGIYYYNIYATEYAKASTPLPDTTGGDTALVSSVSIAVDSLRLLDVTSTGITSSTSLATVKYTLTNTAGVTLRVYPPNTTFPGGVPSATALQTIAFYRTSGTYTETWDGRDSTGLLLGKGVYVFSLEAVDDSGNRATNQTGNDSPVYGSIPIDRTAPTTAGNTTPPTIVSTNPANGVTATSSISEITAVLSDTSGSGLDFSKCTIALTSPSGTSVAGTVSNNAVDTITLSLTSPLTVNGTYTITVTAYNNNGYSTTTKYTFNYSLSSSIATVESTVTCYPNPAKGYTYFSVFLATNANVNIDVYNLLGEKVWSYSESATAGQKNYLWKLINDSGKSIASDMYIYIMAVDDGTNVYKIKKKILVIN